ncbi:MAG: L-threonylcarbamoyladenylate synthase [Polyangia bacterium]
MSVVAADDAAIARAAQLLLAGELVAFPTETVYGLGGLALDRASLAKIFRAKGRPPTHPLIAHVRDAAEAAALSSRWDARAQALAERFWPGPLTLVVPRAATVPAELSGGKPTVAVRSPAHPVAQALLARVGQPLAAPSANRYQSLSPTTAAHVAHAFGDELALILDGGPCAAGLESTVLDLTVSPPAVLRPGALPLEALRALVPDVVVAGGAVGDEADRHSPGQDPIHYAPRAPLRLGSRKEALAATGAALVLRGRGEPARPDAIVLPDDPVGYGRALYATLHALDDAGAAAIVVELPPDDEAWLAVADRLRRAAAK